VLQGLQAGKSVPLWQYWKLTQNRENAYLAELRWRGFLDNMTSEDLGPHLSEARRTIYVGFDPTADSLHLGSLVPVMALAHAQRHGHRPLALAGGGTGLIGDPSGKSSERTLLSKADSERNTAAIGAQLSKFFDLSSPESGLLLNNGEWLQPLGLIDFLRDIGKHFSVNEMMKRDSVRMRLEEREHGISYTEFTYMLLQAYDFLHLFQHYGCTTQMGGSDQWGNIVSGIELIRRMEGQRSYGITVPLLMSSTGKKFGKTEEGAVWLDPNRTSPYRMYQYWVQTADADVIAYLKLFTFLDQAGISELELEVKTHAEKREAQRVLAAQCTDIVHGAPAVKAVEAASRILFSDSVETATPETIQLLSREVPTTQISRLELENKIGLIDLLVRTHLADSKAAARKLVEGGGVYLYNERQNSAQRTLSTEDLKWPGAILLRTGKRNFHLVVVT
jgi:tyrosyl-tRNA synthetase